MIHEELEQLVREKRLTRNVHDKSRHVLDAPIRLRHSFEYVPRPVRLVAARNLHGLGGNVGG